MSSTDHSELNAPSRIRGLLRTSFTAGAVLSVLATGTLLLGIATGLVPSSIFGPKLVLAVAIRDFVAGSVAGGLFSWFVARGERGKSLATLSTRRVALWGGLATASVPVFAALAAAAASGVSVPIGLLAASTAIAGIGGSVVSAGMLRLARRAPVQLADPAADPERLLR